MASKGVKDWDEPLPTSESTEDPEQADMTYNDCVQQDQLRKLQRYVDMMAYEPIPPPKAKERSENLAKPKYRRLVDVVENYMDVTKPKMKKDRLRSLVGWTNTITTEHLADLISASRAKEKKKEEIYKRKQEIYYNMLTKLEQQCRNQYLNVLIEKFANFMAKLATTMSIPPTLVEPYARMQRGIFCNILLAIGVQPKNQAAIYYNTEEAAEYEMCHKLSHALLSLIIKALDSASTRDPKEVAPLTIDIEMDKYIKDRLMCAAEKKVMNALKKGKPITYNKPPPPIDSLLRNCTLGKEEGSC